MPSRSVLGGRARNRAWRLRAVVGVAVAVLAAVALLAAYEAGRVRRAAEIEQLRRENARLRAVDDERVDRLVAALARVEVLEARNAELERRLARQTPDAGLRALVELLRERLREGIGADRLAFLLRSAAPFRACAIEEEGKAVFVGVPLARARRNYANLAGGRLTVRLEGEPERDAEGRPEAWYDTGAPVRLSLTTLDGRSMEAEGVLPLFTNIVVADREYRILAQPDERRGFARLVVESCAWP